MQLLLAALQVRRSPHPKTDTIPPAPTPSFGRDPNRPAYGRAGTGKTFVGVEACLAILGSSSQKIMCVTYTNHALDQFLEVMLFPSACQLPAICKRFLVRHV
jgi:hypothetical protein